VERSWTKFFELRGRGRGPWELQVVKCCDDTNIVHEGTRVYWIIMQKAHGLLYLFHLLLKNITLRGRIRSIVNYSHVVILRRSVCCINVVQDCQHNKLCTCDFIYVLFRLLVNIL
jgi:hypothetical protein